jgi:hypothetical protein
MSTLSQTQQKCILCDKFLSGKSEHKVGTKTYDLTKLGEKFCSDCDQEYCKKYPQFASTEICKNISKRKSASSLATKSSSTMPSAMPSATTSGVSTAIRKSPYLDPRCERCKKYVIKRKNQTPLTDEEIMDEKIECPRCKEACDDIQSDHPTDIKFCQMVHDIITSGLL